MPTSGAGDFSPDGKRLAYSPLFRDFRTWKRYEGGWAQDLYLYDLATSDVKPFATSTRTERDPMWIGDAIYFASDRDGTLNLYAYDLKAEAGHEAHQQHDLGRALALVRQPVAHRLRAGRRAAVFDVKTNADQAISVFVPNDGVAMRPSRYSVEKNIEDFELSPKGERALLVARGDVFTLPIEKGPTRNLTATSGVHDKLGALVAGRQAHRLRLRRERRGRDLAGGPGGRQARAGHERPPGHAPMRPSGRRKAPTSRSPTRTASSSS